MMISILIVITLQSVLYRHDYFFDFFNTYLEFFYVVEHRRDFLEALRIYTYLFEKIVDNLVITSISILFINKTINDYKSNKRHYYRLTCGMKGLEYYLGNMIVEYVLYIVLMIPTLV